MKIEIEKYLRNAPPPCPPADVNPTANASAMTPRV